MIYSDRFLYYLLYLIYGINLNKKLLSILIGIILIFTINNTVSVISDNLDIKKIIPVLNEYTIYVDDNNKFGPWDGSFDYPYQFIKDGVINAKNGYTIFIFNGLYNESLIIDKTLSIIGENKKNTIIDGEYTEIIVNILANNVEIKNLTIKNSDGYKFNAGIKITSDNNSISNCEIFRIRNGIFFDKSNNNKIINCTFHTNGISIFHKSSSKIHIRNSEIYHNGIGIYLQNSNLINIFRSYLHTNGIGIYSNYSLNIEISDSAICDNNDNEGGVFLYKSKAINITNCNIWHNGVGFKIYNSSFVQINRCTLSNNTHFTVYVRQKSNNIIVSNSEIIYNFRYGFHISDSECMIFDNNIYGNSIDSIHVKSSFCDARNNWWGKIIGPFFTGFRIIDRIKINAGRILFRPWYFKSLEKVGTDWKTNDFFIKSEMFGYGDHKIELTGIDTDDDGVPNWWEEKWGYNPSIWDDHINIDLDNDSLNNFEECYTDKYGSNPFYKDIFIEFDWMLSDDITISNKPSDNLVNEMKNRFKEHNITLHVDLGNLDGGEEIPFIDSFPYEILIDLYWDYFLHNDLNNPRKNIFHYGLIVNQGPWTGFAFIGWAHLNSFCISAQQLAEGSPNYARGQLIMTGSMHETGHTLGLFVDDFGGNDNRGTVKPWYKEFWLYRNYKSCMNYRYTWEILDYSDGNNGNGDFDDWGNIDFSFFKNTHFEWPKY